MSTPIAQQQQQQLQFIDKTSLMHLFVVVDGFDLSHRCQSSHCWTIFFSFSSHWIIISNSYMNFNTSCDLHTKKDVEANTQPTFTFTLIYSRLVSSRHGQTWCYVTKYGLCLVNTWFWLPISKRFVRSCANIKAVHTVLLSSARAFFRGVCVSYLISVSTFEMYKCIYLWDIYIVGDDKISSKMMNPSNWNVKWNLW